MKSDKEPNFGNRIKLEGATHLFFDKETCSTIARFNIRGYGGTKGTIAGLNYKGNGGFFLSIEEAIKLVQDCYSTENKTEICQP